MVVGVGVELVVEVAVTGIVVVSVGGDPVVVAFGDGEPTQPARTKSTTIQRARKRNFMSPARYAYANAFWEVHALDCVLVIRPCSVCSAYYSMPVLAHESVPLGLISSVQMYVVGIAIHRSVVTFVSSSVVIFT